MYLIPFSNLSSGKNGSATENDCLNILFKKKRERKYFQQETSKKKDR